MEGGAMNQKTLKNSARVLSFLLACILVLCAIPFTTAFAADADKEYIINDSSFDMDDYLAGAGDANIIKISANFFIVLSFLVMGLSSIK